MFHAGYVLACVKPVPDIIAQPAPFTENVRTSLSSIQLAKRAGTDTAAVAAAPAEIRSMIGTMKAAQQKDIDEMQRKLGRRE